MIYGRSHDLTRFVAYLPTPSDPRAYVKWSLSYNEAMNLLDQLTRYREERHASDEAQDG